MATAEQLRRIFTDYLDSEDYLYQVINEEDNIVAMSFSPAAFGESGVTDVKIFIDFDEDGDQADSAHFAITSLVHVPMEKRAATLVALNGINQKWRWVKAYIDDDGDVWVDGDTLIDTTNVSAYCLNSVYRMGDIAQKIYSELMRVMWAS